MESILNSTKKILGIDAEYTVFDFDVMTFINGALSTLQSLGVGPIEGFAVTGQDDEWSELELDVAQRRAVQTYVYMKVRLLFDPPANPILVSSLNEQIKEMEFRMNVRREAVSWAQPNDVLLP